jgi:hypothetical protein
MSDTERGISRREFLRGAGLLALATALRYESPRRVNAQENEGWPTDQEGILNKIKELKFTPGSELRTNFFPRKTMWETVQLLKAQGKWPADSDESDWMKHPEIIEGALDMIAGAGVKGARLVVVPFEVTQDGETYDWTPMDKMLEMFHERNLVASLSAGPLDYPFGPAGVRLPIKFQDMLRQTGSDFATLKPQFEERGKNLIHISMNPDPNFPEYSTAIRDYALNYMKEFLARYANDPRVDKFPIGNEWPDAHAIEGVNGDMSVGQDFMEEVIKMMKAATSKKIALNTNIPPSDPEQMKHKLGALLELLGNQGVLGLDPYPTREAADPNIAKNYGADVERLRQIFPGIEIVFFELQNEPWPREGVAGKSWAEIQRDFPEEVTKFYQEGFPPAIESYLINSGIREIGLYGSPAWTVFAQSGNDFPLRLVKTMSEMMEKQR